LPDSAALPPEINASLVHGGTGPGTLETAVAAYSAASAQDEANAVQLSTLLAALRTQYEGKAAERATQALTPLITWFHTNAASAAASAAQIQSVASAVTAAIAGTPHPTLVTENRTTWGVLNATNFFGMLTPAINAKDADYLEMWVRSAFGRGSSDVESTVAAGALKPWEPPPLPVNMASFGSSGASVAAAMVGVPEAVAMSMFRRANDLVLDGLLAEGAASSALGAGSQGYRGTALTAAASGQVSEGPGESKDAAQQAGEMGGNQLSGMAGQMGGMVSSVASLPASSAQSLGQPIGGLAQMPMQAGSALQPVLSMFSGAGGGLNPAASLSGLAPGWGSGIATGSGPAGAVFTRPSGGAGGVGLRLPGSSMMSASTPASGPGSSGPGSSNKGATLATLPAAMAAGPGMFGAPTHPGQGSSSQEGAADKYESHTLGALTPASAT
jgi:PPE-repeat protein